MISQAHAFLLALFIHKTQPRSFVVPQSPEPILSSVLYFGLFCLPGILLSILAFPYLMSSSHFGFHLNATFSENYFKPASWVPSCHSLLCTFSSEHFQISVIIFCGSTCLTFLSLMDDKVQKGRTTSMLFVKLWTRNTYHTLFFGHYNDLFTGVPAFTVKSKCGADFNWLL